MMLNRLRQVLSSSEQEEQCRQHHFSSDKPRAKAGMMFLALPFVVFIFNDCQFLGFSEHFFLVLALRLTVLVTIGLEVYAITKMQSRNAYDQTVTWGLLLIVAVSVIATQPYNYIIQIIATCFSVLIIYTVIPNRFIYQFLLSSAASIAEVALLILFIQPAYVFILYVLTVSLVLTNFVAIFSALQMRSYRNKSFRTFLKNQELRTALEMHTKHLESLVEERTEKLKYNERLAAIGATAGMVGHDIRNPLTAITGAVYLAKKNLKNIPPSDAATSLEENLDLIIRQTVYVNKIVADLQDYARNLHPALEKIECEPLLQSVVSGLQVPSNISVSVVVKKQGLTANVDATYLQRIVTNLCNNAIDAMPNGGKLTVTVAAYQQKVVLTVEDTGMGIAEETRTKLFTPLVTTKSKGQGFGLAVVKRLTEAMGGTVKFDSEVGKGTKFTVKLPQQES
jgi:signal transduction histidine kinase